MRLIEKLDVFVGLEIEGEDMLHVYEKILNKVTFDNTADTPSDKPRRYVLSSQSQYIYHVLKNLIIYGYQSVETN